FGGFGSITSIVPCRSGGRVFLPSPSLSSKSPRVCEFDLTSQASTLPSLRTPITSGTFELVPSRPVAVRQLRCIVTYSYSPDSASFFASASIASACPGVRDEDEHWP